jgi:hypothetical protein
MISRESLSRRKQSLLNDIARLELIVHKDSMPGVYVTGRDGVSQQRQQQLNHNLERIIDAAVEISRREAELRRVETSLEALDRAPEIALRKAARRVQQEEMFAGIQVGDLINVGGNLPLEVARKNKKSLITTGGTKWTVSEVVSVVRKKG